MVEGLRSRLRSGETVVGSFVKLPTTAAIEIARSTGLDFVVIDLEHSGLSEAMALGLLHHAHALAFPALVRIPANDAGSVNRLLEAGAAGIQLSTVVSVSDVEQLVAATRYPPQGQRSLSLSNPAADYGATGLRAYLDAMADGPLLVGQIETAHTDDPLERIAASLDVVFIGSTDLTLSLGVPGDLDDPRAQARMDEIAAASREAGAVLGGWVPDPARVAAVTTRGGRYLMVGSDLQWLRRMAADTVAGTRAATAD